MYAMIHWSIRNLNPSFKDLLTAVGNPMNDFSDLIIKQIKSAEELKMKESSKQIFSRKSFGPKVQHFLFRIREHEDPMPRPLIKRTHQQLLYFLTIAFCCL